MPLELRELVYHFHGDVKHNSGLVPVNCAAINFPAALIVQACQQKRDRCRHFTFTLFFWNLYIHGSKLAALITFTDDTENIANNTLLPVNKIERFAIPFSFSMAEVVDKKDRRVSEALFIYGARGLESAGFITSEFT